ncbi:MAG: hypothetical protein KDN05_02350 [Verrucomicrobiae bacterium]|nr:hypothetical protein [Verrucomicrobiae bacterium]
MKDKKLAFKITAAAASAALATASARAALVNYTADANTVYLFHLDEAAGASTAANSGTAGYNGLAVDGNPLTAGAATADTTLLGATSYTGYGNAISVASGLDRGLGVDVTGDGTFDVDDDTISLGTLVGTNNSFTLEAMINLPSLTASSHREIWCTDNSAGNGDRGFQFRITSGGLIEYNFIGDSTTNLIWTIPTTGDNAFQANTWFHIAMTYTETGVGSPTLEAFWTLVDPSRTQANSLGAVQNANQDFDGALVAPLVFGNEGRNTGSGVNMAESFLGSLDEGRISNVVRGAGDFIFVPEPSSALLGSLGVLALLRRRRD